MRCADWALAIVSAALIACGSGASDAGADPQTGPSNLDPSVTAADLKALAELSPAVWPSAPADASNRFADDPRAALFGRKLFFETGFSGKLTDGDNDGTVNTVGTKGQTGRVSCASCHVPQAGFLDDRTLGKQISLAAGWGLRRAPSLLDVGQARLVMWDGRHDALYNQVFGPIESSVEMNSSRLYVARQMFALHRAEYEAIFGPMPALADETRFPALSAELTGCQPSTVDPETTCNGSKHGMPGDGAEFDRMSIEDQDAVTRVVVNLGKAIGAYQRQLHCGPGRFDQWLAGKSDALSFSEQRGAAIFVGRGKCATCHSGPFLSDQKFHNVGLMPAAVAVVFIDHDDPGAVQGLSSAIADPLNVRGKFSDGDDGRLPASVDQATTGAFRTPMLRCVARRPSFMHTAQLRTLRDVVNFFAKGGDAFGYLGKSEIAALDLSAQDTQDLVAFLGTLEGPGPAPELLSPPP